MKSKVALLLILSIQISSCAVTKTEKMTYRNKYVLIDPRIRVDGFYYRNKTDSLVDIMVFFKNGFIYQSTYADLNTANRMLNESLKASKYGWGAYIIDGNTLKIQSFEPRGNELKAIWEVVEKEGNIHEDGTITSRCLYNGDYKDSGCNYSFLARPINSDGSNWLMDKK